ncbi:MAG: hypothetical protein RI964_948 [Pseudomonadota bacterium]
MFLKSLSIMRGDDVVIRYIKFHLGLNLIVDETPVVDGKETGNNIGKTTILKLIDFCLGGKPKWIYSDHENKKNEYKLVKDFLIEKRVKIALTLKDDLVHESSREICIERNFLARKDKIQRINGENKTDGEFDESLTNILFPGHYGKKPTFRQIIAHNIRYKDSSINHTLKNLDSFTRDDEYETLYLFLFGCDFEQGDTKQELRTQIDIEEKFKKKLEFEQTKSAYETALSIINSEIEELGYRKSLLNVNQDFENDLNELNKVKYEINQVSSEISRLELRKELILEAEKEIKSTESSIDIQQLRSIYFQATSLVSGIQKTFEELCHFHNKMVKSKIGFITQDLPKVNEAIAVKRKQLDRFLVKEKELSLAVVQTDSFEILEQLIIDLNSKHQKKGEYENILRQLNNVELTLEELNANLAKIDTELFSDDFYEKIKQQLNKFNHHFSSISYELYGEKYALKVDVKKVRSRRLYEFSSFNTNFSSGKKQGEISCFDIAYTLFADEEHIPCMHFLLNDKKELMHDNQLLKIANLVNRKDIQFVASILRDKLPEALNKDDDIIIKLSQKDKLFKIES